MCTKCDLCNRTLFVGVLISATSVYIFSKSLFATPSHFLLPPRLTQLPNELLLDIFDHLDWHKSPPSSYASLRRSTPLKKLSCVNRQFRSLLTPRLFRTLINSKRCYLATRGLHQPHCDLRTDLSHLYSMGIGTQVQQAIRNVDLDVQPRPGQGRQLYYTFQLFLPNLRNLRTLRIRTNFAQMEALESALGTVEEGGLPSLVGVEEMDVQCHAAALLKCCPNAHTLHVTFTKKQTHCADAESREYGSHEQHHFPPSDKVAKLHCRGDWFDALGELAEAYPRVRRLAVYTDTLWSDCRRVATYKAIGACFAQLEYWEESWGDGNVLKYTHVVERDGDGKVLIEMWKRPICITPG